MSYPRAKDTAITSESLRRLTMVARENGAMFKADLFTALREPMGAHTHEALNPTVLDVAVNRNLAMMSLEEKVLVTLTQNLIDNGSEGRLDRSDVSALPAALRSLNWSRMEATSTRLWEVEPEKSGLQAWSRDQSLLHFMMKNELGRLSTMVSHIEKFLSRGLVTQQFDLTEKGKAWSANVEAVLGHRNGARLFENYIEHNRDSPSKMVRDMVALLDLQSVSTAVEQQVEQEDYEQEISAGYVP